jgi:DNA (cytosine-5)-methyltransferase 1
MKIKVVELFAGVGGFRLGLEGWNGMSSSSNYKKPLNSNYEVVWSNQWEPSTKKQHASEIYENRWGADNHSNIDISKVKTSDIPDHDILVGGFPCQDYSVARVLSHSKGIEGKKGVLWWDIHRILKEKGGERPRYLILENVDRLISSPASQRGRDFSIMLASLSDLGYAVEWRIINAADFGMPQKRKRVFIVGYLRGTKQYNKILKNDIDWILNNGTLAEAFPINNISPISSFDLKGELDELSNSFNLNGSKSLFENSGVVINRQVITVKTKPRITKELKTLGNILCTHKVDDSFYISKKDIDKWQYYKGAKNELRKRRDGNTFKYTEGKMNFPDKLDAPSRTIITSEGGKTPSRTTHVIKDKHGLRRLTPIELERLNMFPDNHTKEATDTKRAFFMGNALVVGVVEKIGIELYNKTYNELQ